MSMLCDLRRRARPTSGLGGKSMERSTKAPGSDLPPAMRGSAPADLHAYRGGRRLSHDTAAASSAIGNFTASLRNLDEQRLARALGWFSVALGVAEVVAPKQLGRAIGIHGKSNLLR